MKSVVITGVSSGIGLECSKYFAANGYRVFGSIRTEEDAAKAQKEIGPHFTPLLFDVTDEKAIKKNVKIVEKELNHSRLDGLINNAGIAISGPLMHLPLKDFKEQLEINILGVHSVTQAFLPLLGARKENRHRPGRILNISSVSGKIGYPFAGPYAASKHALEAYSHSLRRELLIYGIDVIIVGPGSVATPIWHKTPVQNVEKKYDDTDYNQYLKSIKTDIENPKNNFLKSEFVAQRIYKIFHKKHPKTRYPIYSNRLQSWIVHHFLSDRMLDFIIKKKIFKQ